MPNCRNISAIACGLLLSAQVGFVWAGQMQVASEGAADNVATLALQTIALHQKIHQNDTLIRPNDRTVKVYIGNRTDAYLLRMMSIRIDDEPETSYHYNPKESEALRGTALHHLMDADRSIGVHRLHADYLLRKIGATPDEFDRRGSVDLTFSKAENTGLIELSVENGDYLHEPTLKLRP